MAQTTTSSRPTARASSNGHAPTEETLARVAEKSKAPALAGGAAIAGLVGGVALSSKLGSRSKLLGIPLPARSRTEVASRNLADAAKHLGRLGDRVGDLAIEVKKVREGFEQPAGRSPIEVLLQGLSSRR